MDTVTGAELKAERDLVDVGQEAIARQMNVSVKTIQRIEAMATVNPRRVREFRAALAALSRLPGPDNDRPIFAPLPDRRPLSEMLKKRGALKWLLAFRDELDRRGVDADLGDTAVRLVTQEENLLFLAKGAAAAGAGFTEQETIDGLESAARGIRQRFDGLGLRDPSREAQVDASRAPLDSRPFAKPVPDQRDRKKKKPAKRASGSE